MARKTDTGWRDSRLPQLHARQGFDTPAPGVSFAMLEYDRGEPLAVVSYLRRDAARLPKGPEVVAAYRALSNLYRGAGRRLPFLTARYDSRNWAFQLFGHNDSAWDLIGRRGWHLCTEEDFARLLYRLRGRVLPELDGHGVSFSRAAWPGPDGALKPIAWPGQDLSVRRRAYEPAGRVPIDWRNPCADFDLAVIGRRSAAVSLFVDYKLSTARVNPGHMTHHAMSRIRDERGRPVPSVIVRYEPGGERWAFSVLFLNAEAQDLFTRVLSTKPAASRAIASVGDWGHLTEHEWFSVLEGARGV